MIDKYDLREEIKQLTDRYLSEGGLIEVLPTKRVLPKTMKWAKEYGWDYTPWALLGASTGMFLYSDNARPLGNGSHISMPVKIED